MKMPAQACASGAKVELRRIANAVWRKPSGAFLLRFVTMKRASWDHYPRVGRDFRKVSASDREARAKEKKSAPIKRPILLMSWNGRGFTRLVLRSYYDQRITLNDVSSYLGAKVKYIPELRVGDAFQPAD